MTINLSTLFSVVVAVLGVYATYEKIHREHKKELEERLQSERLEREKQTERHIEIKKELEFIARDVNKTATNFSAIDTKVDEMDKEVVKVSESVKSAHHRIDTLEERCNKKNG